MTLSRQCHYEDTSQPCFASQNETASGKITTMTNLSRKLQNAINWAFAILTGVLPFVFCWLSDELFEFNKMLVVYLFATLIGCLFLARMVVERRFLWQKTIFDWPLGLFLASQIIATIFSLHPRTSWLGYYTRLNGGMLSTLAYLVLYYSFVNNVNLKARSRLLKSLFLSGIVVSLYAIGEHYGHSMSCLIIKGHFDVACWVQKVQERVFATFGQPNWLAAYNVTIIGFGTPLILQFFRQHERSSIWSSRFLKFLIPSSVYLNFVSLLFTKSRSGIIAFAAGLVLTSGLLLWSWMTHQPEKFWLRCRQLLLITAGFLLPALIWGTQYSPSLAEFIPQTAAQTTPTTNASPSLEMGLPAHLVGLNVKITDSGDIRKIVWRGAFDIWKHFPLFGTGVETFAYSYYLFRPTDHNWTSEWDYLYNKAHNELLNLAANSGTFGLVTYLAIFLTLAWITLRLIAAQPTPHAYMTRATYLIGICASLFALSITNFFGFSTVSVQTLMYLLLAWAAVINGQIQTTPLNNQVSSGKQKFALVIIALLGLFCLDQVWRTWYADYNYARCKALITRADMQQIAINRCQTAISLRPKEALYQIELADYYAQYAVAAAKQNPQDVETIEKLANQALLLSNNALRLNSRNLNFYKTRFRTLLNLAQIDPDLAYENAKETLETAMILSPTDPKLTYYYSTLLNILGDQAGAEEYLAKTLELRPLYYEARLRAADQAEAAGQYEIAYNHYQYLLQFIDETNQQAREGAARTATLAAQLSQENQVIPTETNP